jgi:hypothetical protein
VTSAPTSSTAVRISDAAAWPRVPDLSKRALISIVAPFAMDCEVDSVRACSTVVTGVKGTETINQVTALSILGHNNIYKPPQGPGGGIAGRNS